MAYFGEGEKCGGCGSSMCPGCDRQPAQPAQLTARQNRLVRAFRHEEVEQAILDYARYHQVSTDDVRTKHFVEAVEDFRRKPRAISCGCCDGGCICQVHQDLPKGKPPTVCAYHSDPRHQHPRVTEV